MCLSRIVQRLGFALAAVGIVLALGLTIEYQPVINALGH